ncbi:hypothetical protein O3P69_020762 [Scylla paramamosain]|uniref:Secreted protein n=1 Tax=Scylla paramamosain TaxID=85552 RepID=A0AAW0TQW3_SCYPA
MRCVVAVWTRSVSPAYPRLQHCLLLRLHQVSCDGWVAGRGRGRAAVSEGRNNLGGSEEENQTKCIVGWMCGSERY